MPKFLVGEAFIVSLISGIEKIYASEGYVTFFDFLSTVSFLTVPKKFVGKQFCVPEKFWYRKLLGTRDGAKITISRRKIFCLTVPKIFVGESFSVSFILAIKKFWTGGGREYRDFRRSFCLTVPNFFIGEHFGL